MVGQPILEEHSGKQIGQVKGGVIEGDQIKAFIEVSRNNIEGIRAIAKLRDGTLKGLSLGMEFLLEMTDEGPQMRDKKINEISLTSDPDCPSALIQNVGPDSELWIAKANFWKNKVTNGQLKTQLYKSIEELQELNKLREKMTETAPEKAEIQPEPQKDVVVDYQEKAKELEAQNNVYVEELRRIRAELGGDLEFGGLNTPFEELQEAHAQASAQGAPGLAQSSGGLALARTGIYLQQSLGQMFRH